MIRDTAAQDRSIERSATGRVGRWLGLAAAGAVAVSAVFVARAYIGGERSIDVDRLRIATVTRGTLVRDIVADAKVTAKRSPTLYATAAGTVTLSADAGDTVAPGQVIATIDSPELRSQLAQQRAMRDQLAAELGRSGLRVEQARARAQSLVDQAEIDRVTASRELQRDNEAFDSGAVPEITMLRSKDALAKADIALAQAKQNLTLENKGLKFDRRSTAQQLARQQEVVRELERKVEALAVRAPADGIVGQVLVDQRATVAANAPLFTVVDLTALELEIKVPEGFARDLAVSVPAEIKVQGDMIGGRVRSVSPEVVAGEVAARVAFADEPPVGLRQNQRLSVRIVVSEKPDVLLVDRGPSLDDNRASAYFVRGDVAERGPIRLGEAGLANIEILSGAREGDRIVVSGADHFDTAERVQLTGDLP